MRARNLLLLSLPIIVLFAGIIVLSECSAADPSPEIYTVGDFDYEVTFSGVYVQRYRGSDTVVTVPEKVQLPGYPMESEVVGIQTYAFFGCNEITTINLSKEIRYLDPYWCSNLSYYIEDQVSLAAINVAADNPYYKSSVDGVLSDKSGMYLMRYPPARPNTTVDATVYQNGIDAGAFEGCKNLENVLIYDRLRTALSNELFKDCINLRYINFDHGTGMNTLPPVSVIGDSAFYGCSSLINIQLPETLSVICDFSFYGCSSLESVCIPSGLTSIGRSAFSNCEKMSTITSNSSSFVAYGNVLFYKYNTGVYSSDSMELVLYPISRDGASYTIGRNVTSIRPFAFQNTEYLKEVRIDSDIVVLPDFSFAYCESLEKITLNEKTTVIGEGAFMDCTLLKEIVIPSNLQVIDSMAFYGCFNLKNIDIGSKVEEIGDNAFSYTGIREITLPSAVAVVGIEAFKYSDLEKIRIEGSPSMGNEALMVDRTLHIECSESFSVPPDALGDTPAEYKYFDKWTFPMYNAVGIGVCVILLLGIIVLFRRI